MKHSFTKKFLSLTLCAISCIPVVSVQCKALKRIETSIPLVAQSAFSASQLVSQKNIPTIGFRNSVANYFFVQFLQYFGDDEARQKTGYEHSSEYLATTIHHDPYFKDFYVFLSGSSTLYAGTPEKTLRVLSEGLEQLKDNRAPDSYFIWRYKATDELLFMNDAEAAQSSFKMAAQWADESIDENAALVAKVSRETAQFLADNPNSKRVQIDAWSSVFSTALDDETRNRVISKIRELGGDIIVSKDGQFYLQYSEVEDFPNRVSSEVQSDSES